MNSFFEGSYDQQGNVIHGGVPSPSSDKQKVSEARSSRGMAFTDYNIESLSYPADLSTSPEYGGNKVLFFINIESGSKDVKGEKIDGADLYDIPDSDVLKTSGRNVEKLANDVTEVAKKIPGFGDFKVSKMKRLSKAIALHMPNSLAQRTSVGWSEKNLLDLNPALMVGLDALSKGSANALVGGMAGRALGGNNIAERAARKTPGNSGAEQLFEGVDYRSMSFSYAFTPKNKKEADNVMRIIRTFKYHMLPEYAGDTEFLYRYPSEFQIKYYIGSEENPYVEKQLTAVLTAVNIDYTALGQWATFKDGMPQKINMSLEFKEIGTGTKEIASFTGRHGI